MKTVITIIRVAIGWRFLYEGFIKLFADQWSSAGYLNSTHGFLSGFYHWLAESSVRLGVVDFLNIWGLILIGLALFLGLCARWAAIFGAVYIINQLFIEAAVLVFLFCCKEKGYGLDHLLHMLKKKKQLQVNPVVVPSEEVIHSRREILKNLAAIPVLGLFGWGSCRRNNIYGTDTMSGADDVNICIETLQNLKNRERSWYA